MSIGYSEEELLAGYAAWLRWLEQKRSELEGKQAKMERRMKASGGSEGGDPARPQPAPLSLTDLAQGDPVERPQAPLLTPPVPEPEVEADAPPFEEETQSEPEEVAPPSAASSDDDDDLLV